MSEHWSHVWVKCQGSVGWERGVALVEIPVNKGTLLSDVRVASVPTCKSDVTGVLVQREVCHVWKYVYGVRKSKSWPSPCVSALNFRMRVCSSINESVLLEMSPFNVAHSWSQIEWPGILKCLATGSPLLLSRMHLYDCSYRVYGK